MIQIPHRFRHNVLVQIHQDEQKMILVSYRHLWVCMHLLLFYVHARYHIYIVCMYISLYLHVDTYVQFSNEHKIK